MYVKKNMVVVMVDMTGQLTEHPVDVGLELGEQIATYKANTDRYDERDDAFEVM